MPRTPHPASAPAAPIDPPPPPGPAAAAINRRILELLKRFGVDGAQLLAQAQRAAQFGPQDILRHGALVNENGLIRVHQIALMDALLATELPVIEVHVTNIHKREEFRHTSYVSKVAVGVIAGLGIGGYALALTAMADILQDDA